MVNIIWVKKATYHHEAHVGKVFLAEMYWNPSLFRRSRTGEWRVKSTFRNDKGGFYAGNYDTLDQAREAIEIMIDNLAELLAGQ